MSHQLTQVGAYVDELGAAVLRFYTKIYGDAMDPVSLPARYQSISHLLPDANVHLSEIIDYDAVGSGTYEYWYYATYLDSSLVLVGNASTWGEITYHDLSNSLYGAGWWLQDQIVLIERTDGNVTWLEAGTGGYFEWNPGIPGFETPLGMFGKLEKLPAQSPTYFQFTSADGQVLVFDHDDSVAVEPANGQTIWNISRILDANGNSTEFNYTTLPEQKRLQSIEDAFGRTTTLAYDASGFLDSMTDFVGRVTDFDVVAGKLVSISAPAVPNSAGTGTIQPTLQFGYQGNLLSELVSPNGASMTFDYDANSRLIHQSNFDGSHYEYNAMFARPLDASLTPASPPQALDNRLLRAEEVGPRGHAIHKVVDQFSQPVLRHIEPNYQANPVQAVATKSWARDVQGRITASVDIVAIESTGGGTQYTNAETHYLYSSTSIGLASPLPSIQWQPDEDPEIQNPATDPHITYGFRNASLKPSSIIDELNRTITYTYDRSGSGPNTLTRRYVVGSDDGPNIVDDIQWVYTYSDGVLPKGLIRTETDALGRQTQYFYYDNEADPLTFGRLETIVFPDSTQLSFSYAFETDPILGHSVAMVIETDYLGRVTARFYDALGRLVRVERPHATGGSTPTVSTYRYDANGNLVAEVDAEGNATLYEYDLQNRLREIRQPDPDDYGPGNNGPLLPPVTRFTYDPAGNRRARIDAEGRITTYQYDAANRLFATVRPDVDGNFAQGRSSWTNPVFRHDVNADGVVDALDFNAITAFLATAPGGSVNLAQLAAPETFGFYVVDLNGDEVVTLNDQPLYFDVNGDNLVNAVDSNQVLAAIGVTPLSGPDYSDSAGRAVSLYQLDPAGNRLSETDPLGRTTEYRNDIRSHRVKLIQPMVPDPDNGSISCHRRCTRSYCLAGHLWKDGYRLC